MSSLVRLLLICREYGGRPDLQPGAEGQERAGFGYGEFGAAADGGRFERFLELGAFRSACLVPVLARDCARDAGNIIGPAEHGAALLRLIARLQECR